MNRKALLASCLALALCAAFVTLAGETGKKTTDWNVKATIIEACSCPMFCQCYFNSKPAGHGGHGAHGDAAHFCRFNMAFKVDEGRYGTTDLKGQKFWVAGDLGADFSTGNMDWAVVTFDKASTPEQREGIAAFLGSVFPVKWNSFTTSEGQIEWTAGKGSAHAKLDGGKSAEIKLTSAATAAKKNEPVVIKNLQYWAARSNDGFVLMPNEVEAWRVGDKAFEFKNSNGFMITVHADSKGSSAAAGAGSED